VLDKVCFFGFFGVFFFVVLGFELRAHKPYPQPICFFNVDSQLPHIKILEPLL
jgi:hypothetical protein